MSSLLLTTFFLMILIKKILMKKILMKKMEYRIFFLEKYKKFFRFGAKKFNFLYKKKTRNFCFSGFASSLLKYQKTFFRKNIRVKLGSRKIHFPKYKKNLFLKNYKKFFQSVFLLFFELGMKSVPGSPWIHYWHSQDIPCTHRIGALRR